jgi:GWxTD domain-containing protein
MIFISAYSISAQVEYSSGTNILSNVPVFYVETANYKSSIPDKSRLDVFVQVPYSSIQFIKKDNTFLASYTITLTFYDKNKSTILFERSWKDKINTENFEQTISRSNYNLSYKSFDINPGEFMIRCSFEDSDSRRTAFKEFPITLKLQNEKLALSDIILISEIVKESSGERIVPNISKIVSNRITKLPFYFEIYSDKEQQVILEYYLENLKSNTITKQMNPQKVSPGSNTIYFTIENTDFKLGDYLIKVQMKDDQWKDIASAEKNFVSKIYGFPNSIIDLDKAVAQLVYIASPDELSYLKDSQTYDEKLIRFLAFWDKKKPNSKLDDNPILYEYYRRVEYANKNFKGLGEGWKTDMGMVYITFGPPNSVERHPLDANSVPYEIWDYYDINRSFVFVDQTGFGDYRLVNPDYSRWPGYR